MVGDNYVKTLSLIVVGIKVVSKAIAVNKPLDVGDMKEEQNGSEPGSLYGEYLIKPHQQTIDDYIDARTQCRSSHTNSLPGNSTVDAERRLQLLKQDLMADIVEKLWFLSSTDANSQGAET
jgi:hypothetical protein